MPFYVSPEQVMKDRADYARKGIARGRSLVAFSAVLLIAAYVSVVFYLARKAGSDPAPDRPEIETPQPVVPGDIRSAE